MTENTFHNHHHLSQALIHHNNVTRVQEELADGSCDAAQCKFWSSRQQLKQRSAVCTGNVRVCIIQL